MKHIKFKDILLHEDENLMVVNKPAFLPSLDERSGEGQSLLRMAKRYCPDAQLCHRLDRETSGVLIIAKNNGTYRHISMQFENRKIEKTYHAIVDGIVNFDAIKVDLPIRVDKSNRVNIDPINGKPATTYFNTLKHFNNFTLIECHPISGRMHQIRIHLASQNAVITGDEAYRGKLPYLSKFKRHYKFPQWEHERPIAQRFLLHAAKISFTAINNENVTIKAPYAKDFEAFLKIVKRNDL